MSPDPSGLAYADISNPQSLNLYSYAQNNPLTNVDPTGMDCIHINNDTGAYEGFESGDCNNSTEALANTGHYIDGTVNTIYTSTGDQTGIVEAAVGTSDSGNYERTSFVSATGEQLSQADSSAADQLSPFSMGVFQGVAQQTKFVLASGDCSIGAAATGVAAYTGIPNNPNISPGTMIRAAKSTAKGAVALGAAEQFGTTAAQMAKAFGPEVAAAAGQFAAKSVGKAVPAIAVAQGVYAASKAYNAFSTCYGSY